MSRMSPELEARVRAAYTGGLHTSYKDACFQQVCNRTRVEAAFFMAATFGLSQLVSSTDQQKRVWQAFHEAPSEEFKMVRCMCLSLERGQLGTTA
jgi:hypothetical protein